MRVHVLLYNAGSDGEGIHSLEISGRTIVLMFENPDDAERYGGLLEAQDFPLPDIEELEREEVESFCNEAGYEARLVESGFLPNNDEDRLFISPPETNLDVDNWQDRSERIDIESNSQDLEDFRKKLEDLL